MFECLGIFLSSSPGSPAGDIHIPKRRGIPTRVASNLDGSLYRVARFAQASEPSTSGCSLEYWTGRNCGVDAKSTHVQKSLFEEKILRHRVGQEEI
jgi:hypothetical protein